MLDEKSDLFQLSTGNATIDQTNTQSSDSFIESNNPPAKPKRNFEYIALNCGERSALIASTNCRYIDDDNCDNSSIYKNTPNCTKKRFSNKGSLFVQNLNLFALFKRSCPMKNNDEIDMHQLDAPTPIPSQRYRFRKGSVDKDSNSSNSNALGITDRLNISSNAFSSRRVMNPVNEENDDEIDNYDGSHNGNDSYIKVRRLPNEHSGYSFPIDFNGDTHAFSSSYGEEVQPLSFMNFNKKYSMGGANGRIQDVTEGQPPHSQSHLQISHNKSTASNERSQCCSQLFCIEVTVIALAIFELLFIIYQTVSACLAYDKTGEENAFAFTLILFSFVLAIIAVVLLLIGIHRRSPYFLVPHLLMQFATFSTALALCIYFALLLIGGTSIKVDSVFYEDSALGEIGLAKANALPPYKLMVVAHGLNTILISLLLCSLAIFFLQIWFFTAVRRCYKLFYHLSTEKKTRELALGGMEIRGNMSTNTITANSTRMSPLTSLTTATDEMPSIRHDHTVHAQQHHNFNSNNSYGSENKQCY